MKLNRHIARIVKTLPIVAMAMMQAAAPETGEMPQRESRRKQIEREVGAGGRVVAIGSSSSNINVVTTNGDVVRVLVDLEYWSNEPEWMTAVEEEFDVEVSETSRRVTFSPTSLPDLGRQGWFERLFSNRRVSFELDIELQVPAGTPLELDNRYGDVVIDDIGGPVEVSNTSGSVEIVGAVGVVSIENRYGDVMASDIEGDLELNVTSGALEIDGVNGDANITNSYGDVEIRGVVGNAEVSVTSGAVTAENIGGDARISCSYGDVEAISIGGELGIEVTSGNVTARSVGRLDARSSYGSIDFDDVRGDVTFRGTSVEGEISGVTGMARVESSYGDLLLESIGQAVRVENQSGGVTVNGAGGDTEIETSYAAVRVTGIEGSLTIRGSSAGVAAENVAGPVEIRTSYEGVSLRNISGAVTVINQSGAVTVEDLRGGALSARHSIETSYANITVDWPTSAGTPAFHAESTYGTITTDFPADRQERSSRIIVDGQSDGSSGVLALNARNGSVTLRRR